MCQASEGEAAMVRYMEERDRRRGKPYGCSFQAGFYQCPNEYRESALVLLNRPARGGFGWECRDCGSWYPETQEAASHG